MSRRGSRRRTRTGPRTMSCAAWEHGTRSSMGRPSFWDTRAGSSGAQSARRAFSTARGQARERSAGSDVARQRPVSLRFLSRFRALSPPSPAGGQP